MFGTCGRVCVAHHLSALFITRYGAQRAVDRKQKYLDSKVVVLRGRERENDEGWKGRKSEES